MSNFAGKPTDARGMFAETTYARLRAIKDSVDPDGVFVANHRIPTTANDEGWRSAA